MRAIRFYSITHNWCAFCVLVIPGYTQIDENEKLTVSICTHCWDVKWFLVLLLMTGVYRTNENFFVLVSFRCLLFGAWFIDFLLDIFQDDFYDTSKRARVTSNNNKSSTKIHTKFTNISFRPYHILRMDRLRETNQIILLVFRSHFFFHLRYNLDGVVSLALSLVYIMYT